MRVIRRGNRNGVNVIPFEELSIVGELLDGAIMLLLDCVRLAIEHFFINVT